MANAARLSYRVDAGLLAGCVVLSLIAVALKDEDWDLVLKGFVDVARVQSHNGLDAGINPREPGVTLIGSGVGIEFQFKQNLNIQAGHVGSSP